jgi:tetratricopeptide (TPR) repeat protein
LCTSTPPLWQRRLPTIEEIRLSDPAALEEARIDLTEALSAESAETKRSEMLRLLATTQIRLGSFMDAETLLDEALDIEDRVLVTTTEPADGGSVRREICFLLGVCFQKSGRLERAELMFNDVLAADETHWRSRFHLALLSINRAEFVEAEELLTMVLDESPDHAAAIELLSKLRERRSAEELKLEPPPDESR